MRLRVFGGFWFGYFESETSRQWGNKICLDKLPVTFLLPWWGRTVLQRVVIFTNENICDRFIAHTNATPRHRTSIFKSYPILSCCKSHPVMRRTGFTSCYISCLVLYWAQDCQKESEMLPHPCRACCPLLGCRLKSSQCRRQCTSPSNCVSALLAMLWEKMVNAICAIGLSVIPGSPASHRATKLLIIKKLLRDWVLILFLKDFPCGCQEKNMFIYSRSPNS